MAIIRVDSKTKVKIKAGQWVLMKTNTSICGVPRLVTRGATNERVFFKRPYGENPNIEEFMLMRTIAFVCDTQKEADQLRALSEEQERALHDAAIKVQREFRERLQSLIDTSSR